MARHFTIRSASLGFLLLIKGRAATGALVNRTIDDQEGDSVTGALPTFLPLGTWLAGQECQTCGLHPGIIDQKQVFDGTWSDTTYEDRNGSGSIVQVSFTGSAVYVYNVIVDGVPPGAAIANTNLTFHLDNELVGTFSRQPFSVASGTPPRVSYKVLVYGNASLPYRQHSLQMIASGSGASIVLFDYIVYTTEDDAQVSPGASSQADPLSSPSQSSTPPSSEVPSVPPSVPQASAPNRDTAAVVSGAVGGGVAAILLALLLLLFVRRTSQHRRLATASPDLDVVEKKTSIVEDSPAVMPVPYLPARRHVQELPLEPREPGACHSESASSQFTYQPSVQTASPGPPTNTADTADTVADTLHERLAQLMQQMQSLQTQFSELRAARNTAGGSTGVVPDPSPAEQNMSSELSALRNEVSALRAEVGEQLFMALEVPPSYGG